MANEGKLWCFPLSLPEDGGVFPRYIKFRYDKIVSQFAADTKAMSGDSASGQAESEGDEECPTILLLDDAEHKKKLDGCF